MKRSYIIVISVVVGAIILGLLVGLAMRGFVASGTGNIGVIEIEQVITSAKYIVKDLKSFREDHSIKAVIIRVDSPGGGVAVSQEIYNEVKKLAAEKTVVVSMGSVAASGGYYVSLPAKVIVANPGTLTGSIGTIIEIPIFEELLHKIGIGHEVIKSREYKDIGSPFKKMSDAERKLLKDVIMDVYDQFVEVVVENRNLSKDSVLKLADGRIMSGKKAKEAGLVDTLGSFEDAVNLAGDLIGIEKPHLIYPPKRLSFIDFLIRPVETLLFTRIYYLWR